MGSEVFQLVTVTGRLADDVALTEALGFPELSALGDTERQWRTVLQAKAKLLLEDAEASPALGLHRRRIGATPEVSRVELRLEPPMRAPDWREPVLLRLPVVRWAEAGECHQAYVPALGILVFAPREDLLEERIQAHVRLILLGRRKQAGLKDLARWARVQSLQLGQLELTARIATPKERAASQGSEGETVSLLETLAEELPPKLSRAPVGQGAATKASQEGHPLPSGAWEMASEVENLAQALGGAPRRSVLLVGPAGCGKTALVRELARRRRDVGLGHTSFWSTSGPRLMTGPIGFGMWQERCQRLCQEAAKARSILHLGNLAELVEVGRACRGQPSVGSFLQPWIARGEVLTIAECTPEQVGVLARNDPHLLGAFHQIQIAERTPAQTLTILRHVYAAAPGKAAPEGESEVALARLHQLHLRYALYSANPGRSIRFLGNLLADRFPDKALTEEAVTTAFSRETGLPPVLLDDRLPLDLERTRAWFGGRLLGQPEAIAHVLDLLAIVKARLARPGKPLASLLLIGPTGTGKTELAKALAEFLFGDPARLARFDLNQFNDPAALQRLIGGPLAGSAEGLLTARVREQPFSVLLLDEFEKADPGFFDLLLQILGDGRLTDASGRVADFRNCVIVLTSNLGAQGFQRGSAGFRAEGRTTRDAQEHFDAAVRKFLRPEIYNRLDAVVPFRPLSPEVVLGIAQRQIDLLRQRDGLRLRAVELEVPSEVAEHLARKGYDVRYGARPLKRALERELLVPLAEALGRYPESVPVSARVGIVQGRLRVEVQAVQPSEAPPPLEDPTQSASGRLANDLTAFRRLTARLKSCSATSELESQATLADSLARRLADAQWKSPEQQARLARQPRLKACLEAIATLHQRAGQLETEALSSFYRRETLEPALFAPELEALQADRRRLLGEVFRLRLEAPNDIVLAIYSEHRATLLELASAYHETATALGEVAALDFFVPPPSGRSRGVGVLREAPKKPRQPLASAPEKLIGLVMHLRGDLFFARFESEAGLHLLTEKNHTTRVGWVDTRRPPFLDYQPPEGIERPGTIQAKGAFFCRRFNRAADEVEDAQFGARPWRGSSIVPCLRALLEERLNRAIEAVSDP